MHAVTASPCFTVVDVPAMRDFFVQRLGARVTYDCGWYVNLSWGDRGFAVAGPDGLTLYLFSPRDPSPEFAGYYQ